MKTIKEKEIFPVNAQAIWDIISDPTNSSWVPTVEAVSHTHLTLPTRDDV